MVIYSSELKAVSIKPEYFITLLTNAIDNAIEACEQLSWKKKIIKIKLVIEYEKLIFSVSNPVESKAKSQRI